MTTDFEIQSPEEFSLALADIVNAIAMSRQTWQEYENKWTHDFELVTDSGAAMEMLQTFRHQKAAHCRQIAIAQAELLGLRIAWYGR